MDAHFVVSLQSQTLRCISAPSMAGSDQQWQEVVGVALTYNQQLPQSALGSKAPLQAMKDWHKLRPELFKKQPYYLPGCDTYCSILPKKVRLRCQSWKAGDCLSEVRQAGWLRNVNLRSLYLSANDLRWLSSKLVPKGPVKPSTRPVRFLGHPMQSHAKCAHDALPQERSCSYPK